MAKAHRHKGLQKYKKSFSSFFSLCAFATMCLCAYLNSYLLSLIFPLQFLNEMQETFLLQLLEMIFTTKIQIIPQPLSVFIMAFLRRYV